MYRVLNKVFIPFHLFIQKKKQTNKQTNKEKKNKEQISETGFTEK